MTDHELRNKVLQMFYEARGRGKVGFTDLVKHTDLDVSDEELLRICDQLGERGLLDWTPIRRSKSGYQYQTVNGFGKLKPEGVDQVEGVAPRTGGNFTYIKAVNNSVDNSRTVKVTGSNNQIGDGNTYYGAVTIDQLLSAVDGSDAPETEKAEAKSLLSRALDHPLTHALVLKLVDFGAAYAATSSPK